ncbi:AmmeMemoRadiSam system radical SAM enzyme [Uliginosibacterium sp. H1]|uniref:AmmeMemoRadiSam system radical SAM enzyme n=1 Tax=Uliginosibacterium sp. H1 TaxID=3114757 RepID=UPI002E18B879|nr:AmmeMemoRadiSam system radical SAM enzyme [Uliginosibacterium sp. H1]
MNHPARWWHPLDDGRIECELCPRHCRLHDGQRAACFVRAREGGQLVLTTYGRSSGFCVDPIEKKPLNHFFPGSGVLSFGTAGCNLACKFCQNWDVSKSRDMDRLMDSASPSAIAVAARKTGALSAAFTYNDPVIFAEYAIDTARACHAEGIFTVAVTAGYISPAARPEFFAHMDAANVDLKGFSDGFYEKLTGARLAPVLDTLVWLRHESRTWLEITTLLIPDANDSDAELQALAQWVMRELGPDVPLHFTAFHPDYKLTDRPPTPAATLLRARRIAREAGLHHVYCGNIRHPESATTYCPGCAGALIARDGYAILSCRIGADGRCPDCGTRIAGHFAAHAGNFGNRRIPVRLQAAH